MADQKWQEKIGVTPGKLALVAVLAVVLVTVIYQQMPPADQVSSAEPTEQVPNSESRSSAKNLARQALATSQDARKKEAAEQEKEWPKIKLEHAIAFDPFSRPDALKPDQKKSQEDDVTATNEELVKRQAVRRDREQALALVRQQGVQMVLYDQQERIAVVGDRVVRIGEELQGFRVVAIDDEGITLAEREAARD
jgi:hypothetical protein